MPSREKDTNYQVRLAIFFFTPLVCTLCTLYRPFAEEHIAALPGDGSGGWESEGMCEIEREKQISKQIYNME